MKRPEGFDPQPRPGTASPSKQNAQRSKPNQATASGRTTSESQPGAPGKAPKKQSLKQVLKQQLKQAPSPSATTASSSKAPKTSLLARWSLVGKDAPARPTRSPRADAARQARKAARQRRRYERDEVRRFTRRARHRRFAWITAGSVVAALLATVAIAVYSPILALKKIEVTGTSSVSTDDVLDAVDGQLGTPLALLDSDRLTRDLADFTLIQSYVTETVPPDTLIIHITERKPIGSLATAAGFTVVDPAGVVIEQVQKRPAGIPTIELAGAGTESDVFESVVEVLLALPHSVADQVDRVTAATKDDVTLVLAGAGQRVVWGSADQSDLKARVLATLVATQKGDARVEYDVTAPLSPVIRGT